MTRWISAMAVVCLASAVLWHLTLGQSLTRRIPPGWSWETRYIGFEYDPDLQTGGFSDSKRTTYYHRLMTIDDAERSASVVIRDSYNTADAKTGQISFEYVVSLEVDPITGMHIGAPGQQHYAVLPQDLKQASYTLRQSYLKGVPLTFLRAETIEGLTVYVYAYQGRAEYTEMYQGTQSKPGITVPAGHEIRCADDHFRLVIWAEPITGEAVKIKESCLSGDYVHDVSTGRALEPVLRWEAETAGIEVARQADAVRDRITQLRLARYLPLGLAGLGLICATTGARRLDQNRFQPVQYKRMIVGEEELHAVRPQVAMIDRYYNCVQQRKPEM